MCGGCLCAGICVGVDVCTREVHTIIMEMGNVCSLCMDGGGGDV